MGFIRLMSRQKPKIKVQSSKKDGFSGWIKCTGCSEMIHANDLTENFHLCPKCNFHYRLNVLQRIQLLADEGSFKELFTHIQSKDPLQFADEKPYKERHRAAQMKTGRDDAICVGHCKISRIETMLGVLDFAFMGGSMGSVVGERLTLMIEEAIEKNLPVVIVSASGGARMQESIHSLMQMAKTSSALAKLHKAALPFISILTNPTMGGVTASFASLGDVILAEPGALIGFAGPRVIEQTIGAKLPKGAQTAEFLKEKGMIDIVINRREMKKTLASILSFFEVKQPVVVNNIESLDVGAKLKKLLAVAVGGRL